MINAVYNVRNFWDGRANRRFNGRNPFGDADENARVLRSLEIANQELKSALARGDFPCIGATTHDEYRQHIEKEDSVLYPMAQARLPAAAMLEPAFRLCVPPPNCSRPALNVVPVWAWLTSVRPGLARLALLTSAKVGLR